MALAPQLAVAAPQHQFATTATRLRRPAPATQCTGTTTPEFFEKPKNSFDRRRDDNYAKMESASKRKAGGTALSPGEGRPAKRQKAPVRARPNDAQWCWLHRRRCVERCELCSARCGMCTWTWARCSRLVDLRAALHTTDRPHCANTRPRRDAAGHGGHCNCVRWRILC